MHWIRALYRVHDDVIQVKSQQIARMRATVDLDKGDLYEDKTG